MPEVRFVENNKEEQTTLLDSGKAQVKSSYLRRKKCINNINGAPIKSLQVTQHKVKSTISTDHQCSSWTPNRSRLMSRVLGLVFTWLGWRLTK